MAGRTITDRITRGRRMTRRRTTGRIITGRTMAGKTVTGRIVRDKTMIGEKKYEDKSFWLALGLIAIFSTIVIIISAEDGTIPVGAFVSPASSASEGQQNVQTITGSSEIEVSEAEGPGSTGGFIDRERIARERAANGTNTKDK